MQIRITLKLWQKYMNSIRNKQMKSIMEIDKDSDSNLDDINKYKLMPSTRCTYILESTKETKKIFPNFGIIRTKGSIY